ncbi:glycosyltransferase family 4 protein [Macrococcus capreoli]|uniref:glycosyltransferase family 4 protein n=1 Tax=Macrococcus capreoli TaxID=2982690 RepID=UPI0021D5D27A|nr:glycosyltransferase family 4 protein [Macrococcus sp. TMW 2.2395]MCU7557529.1 glycosyltransferase family 4 protein [Macrococcus sp. TMW 2.2395]
MPKILLVTQNFYPEIGSAANRMKNLFLHLKANGYDVHVFTTEPSYPNRNMYKNKKYYYDETINALEGTKITRISMRHEKHKHSMTSRIYHYTEFMLKVHYFVRKTSHLFDYIYVSSPNIFTAWGTLFFQKTNTQRILEIRDLWPDSVVALDTMNIKPVLPMLVQLERQMYNNADKIVVNNTAFIPHIKQMLSANKPMLYLPNAINSKENQLPAQSSSFSVVYSGNVGLAQNIDQLIEIAERLNEAQITFNAIIYGVNANQFKAYVKERQLKYVNVFDPMPRQECLQLMAKSHIALSILKDTDVFLNVMPGKVIDAICSNVLIVTNLGGDTNQLINEEQIGYARESATTDELMTAILEYKHNRQLYQEHRNNTIKIKNRDFIWEKNIHKLINFIEA